MISRKKKAGTKTPRHYEHWPPISNLRNHARCICLRREDGRAKAQGRTGHPSRLQDLSSSLHSPSFSGDQAIGRKPGTRAQHGLGAVRSAPETNRLFASSERRMPRRGEETVETKGTWPGDIKTIHSRIFQVSMPTLS